MESKFENDLFYLCSLIEKIGRVSKNKRAYVIEKIGEENLAKILELAEVYHCEPIEVTAADLIEKFEIGDGNFDNVAQCKFNIPTVFDIGKVYKRVVLHAMQSRNFSPIQAVFSVYNSFVSYKIDDYNSSVYYENPSYLAAFYDKNSEPEKYDFFLANYLEELKKTFSAMPDYVKRETDGNFTPLNFFKIALRDTSNSLYEVAKNVVKVVQEMQKYDVPLNEIDKDLNVEQGTSAAFFQKFA